MFAQWQLACVGTSQDVCVLVVKQHMTLLTVRQALRVCQCDEQRIAALKISVSFSVGRKQLILDHTALLTFDHVWLPKTKRCFMWFNRLDITGKVGSNCSSAVTVVTRTKSLPYSCSFLWTISPSVHKTGGGGQYRYSNFEVSKLRFRRSKFQQ